MQKKLTNIFFRPIFRRKPQRSKRAQNKKNWMNNHLTPDFRIFDKAQKCNPL